MTECLLKLCAHRALGGTQCKAPAMRETDFCRHHLRIHRPAVLPAYIFEASTVPELTVAVRRTVDEMLSNRIGDRLFGQILHELDKRIRELRPALKLQ